MTHRRLLALTAVFVLVALAGCIGPFASGGISNETLDESHDYDLDTEYDADIEVEDGAYHAVYHLGEETTFELSQRSYYQDEPVDIRAVRFVYPNGTERTGSELGIDQSSSTTTIEVPTANGTLAFTGPAGSSTVRIPGLVEGSYRVALPPDHRVGNFFLSDVRPSGSDRVVVDDRQILTWEDNDDDIQIRFYLWRDHYLFYAIMGAILLVGLVGTAYYRRKIQRIADRRQELGLDVEDERDE